MCGIFGYISNKIEKVNIDRFKLLGVLNETRGEQSCGITIDADIFHGYTYKDKLFRDFVVGMNIEPVMKPVLFGHTRKSSSGTVGEYNTHPFGFGTNKKDNGYAFIGAHNGTLYNDNEIAAEFDVVTRVEEVSNNVTTYRNKIDSEILLESIFQSRSFKPLSRYNGGAALVWYTPDDDTVYLFSGESKDSEYSATSSVERPLHVWIVDNETFAFSSEKTPLLVIGANPEEVFQIDTNTVYAIKKGDFKNATKTTVSRSNCLGKKVYSTTSTHRSNNQTGNRESLLPRTTSVTPQGAQENAKSTDSNSTQRSLFDDYGLSIPQKPDLVSTYKIGEKSSIKVNDNTPVDLIPASKYGSRLHLKDFRFYRNGHAAVSGVYLYIPGFGLKYIADTKEIADNLLKGPTYAHFDIVEDYFLSDVSKELLEKTPTYNSQRYVVIKSTTARHYTYIFKGYVLETELDYNTVINNPMLIERSNSSAFCKRKLSFMTKYPIASDENDETYGYYIKNGIRVERDHVAGPNFTCVYSVQAGIIIAQLPTIAAHLKGVDIAALEKYEAELEAYKVAHAKAKKEAEEKAKRFDSDDVKKFMTSFFKENANTILIEPEDDVPFVESMVEEFIEAYEEYVDDCFVARQDVGVWSFLDQVKLSCRKYDTTLEEIVFEVATYMSQKARDLEEANDKKHPKYLAYKEVPKLLLNEHAN